MKLTEEQIQSNIKAYEYAMRTGSAEGIEYLSPDGVWESKCGQRFQSDVAYRIKPEPKLRPWKPEEVPIGAIIKGLSFKSIISWAETNKHGEPCMGGPDSTPEGRYWPLAYACTDSDLLHSTDGGKTWLPCGVMEGEE